MVSIITTRRDESTGVGPGQGTERGRFEALLAPHHAVGLSLAARLLGSPDDAEDAVQEALLKAWLHRERLPEITDLRAWWLAVVYRQCVDALRRRHRRRAHEGAQVGRAAPPTDELSARRDLLRRVRELLEDLPPKQAAVLHLRLFEGLDYPSIGRALGLSPRSARVYLVKARAHLRAHLPGELP